MSTHTYPVAGGGGSAYWGDAVANFASLPASGAVVGEVRLVLDTDTFYEWNGSAWIDVPATHVTGPASATDNAVARFDGTTGKVIQNSVVTIDDAGAATGFTTLNASSTITGGNLVSGGTLNVTGATTLATSLTGPLKAASGVVSAAAINLASEVTGTLPVGNGGTGATTFTANGVLLGNTTSAIQVTAAGTANQVFRIPGGGGAPAFGSLNLSAAAAVSGTLPISNGGTNSVTALNNGRVMASISSAIAESSFMYHDTANSRFGLGVSSPQTLLHLAGTNATVTFGVAGESDSSQYTITAAQSGSLTNSGNGRNIIVQAASSDNTAGKIGGVLYLRGGSPTAPATTYGSVLMADLGGNVGIGTSSATASLTLTQRVATTGSPTALLLTGAAHSTLTASTEAHDVNINLQRSVNFSTGAMSLQRAMVVQAPTYTFVGASTITTAATFAITNAPTAGTNATITNRYAFWVQAGASRLESTLSAGGSGTFGDFCSATYFVASNGSAQSTLAATRCTGNSAIAAIEARAASSGSFDIMRWQNNAGSTTHAICDFNGRFQFGSGTAPTAQVEVSRPALTSNSEAPAFSSNAFTQTITSTLTNGRFNQFLAPTITAATAQTTTNAATVYISGAPIAAGSATITNNYALWVDSGTAKFDGNVTVDGVFTLNDGSNIQASTSVVSVSSDVTLTNKAIHLVDTSAARSLTLPSPTSGAHIVIKDSTGSCATNNITIVRAGSEKIETVAASFVLNSDLGAWTFVSNGTDWFIV